MEDNKYVDWIKTHKKQLILAGISATTIVAVFYGIKIRDTFAEIGSSLDDSIKKVPTMVNNPSLQQQSLEHTMEQVVSEKSYTLLKDAFDVSPHIRTMAEGKHHSAKKAVEAEKLGISLLPNQTLVDSYTKYAA